MTVSPAPTSTLPPAAAPTATPTSSPSPGADTYVVVAGDTLWEIGRRFDLAVDELLAANPQITDRNLIRVGDRITLIGACPPISAAGGSPAWSIVDLGSPLGGPAYAVRINDRGEVIVLAYPPSTMSTRGFLWRDGVMTDLGTLGGPSTVAWDMNDRGEVVGSSQTASMEQHPFLWRDGVMTDLGTLGASPFSNAWDIDERGRVVGESPALSGSTHGVIWRHGVPTDLGSIGGDGMAVDINGRCMAVGTSTAAYGGPEHGGVRRSGARRPVDEVGVGGRMLSISAAGLT